MAIVAMMCSCGSSDASKGADSDSKEDSIAEETYKAPETSNDETNDGAAKVGENASAEADGGAVVELTDSAQLEVSGKPMVLDFTATWCGPCQRLKPHFNALSKKMADKVTFIKVDVDKWQKLAQEYGAQSVPTIVVVNADGKKTTTTGYMEEAELEKFISDNI